MRNELIAPLIHRPVARPLAAMLARHDVTPTPLTVLAFLVTLVSAVLYAVVKAPAATAIAGIVLFASTIIDCADGELARLTDTTSAKGAWLDTMLDKVGDAAVALSIVWSFSSPRQDSWPWIVGVSAMLLSILASYARKEHELRFNSPPRTSVASLLAKRDVRTTIIVVGSLLGQPYWAVVGAGALGGVALLDGFVDLRRADTGRRRR